MEKSLNEKAEARMYYKRLMAGMEITDDQLELVKKYYPFMRQK